MLASENAGLGRRSLGPDETAAAIDREDSEGMRVGEGDNRPLGFPIVRFGQDEPVPVRGHQCEGGHGGRIERKFDHTERMEAVVAALNEEVIAGGLFGVGCSSEHGVCWKELDQRFRIADRFF